MEYLIGDSDYYNQNGIQNSAMRQLIARLVADRDPQVDYDARNIAYDDPGLTDVDFWPIVHRYWRNWLFYIVYRLNDMFGDYALESIIYYVWFLLY